MQHAYNNVPYYRQKLRDLGIVPDEIRGLKDFERLPTYDAPIAT
jgi:phenylacetate-CoA ligase